MKNKLSHSSVALYQSCSYCYYLKYIERIRPVKQKSALLFGAALDNSFNTLLLEKDLKKARMQFIDTWTKLVHVDMEYRKKEVDEELINHYEYPGISKNPPWETLYRKGLLFIDAYAEKVLPHIKEVVTVQERFSFKNAEEDEIYGTVDLIVRWEDGRLLLLDNKTSSFRYSAEDARNSSQLSLYHYVISEKYPIDGIGYIVLNKNINKNRLKTCKKCGNITDTRHETCNAMIDGKRCHGEFHITINPTVDVEFIIDQIDPDVQEQVIQMFDEANNGIAEGKFATEHTQPFGKFGPCEYFKWYEGNPDFYRKEKK